MHQGDQSKGSFKACNIGPKVKIKKEAEGKFKLGWVIEACITIQNKNKVMPQILYSIFFFLFLLFFYSSSFLMKPQK